MAWMTLIVPVLLSGGSGSRLWPLSRELYPKQLLPLAGANSMLQETALRVADDRLFTAPVVVCNEEHRFIIAEQLRAIGRKPASIVLEPMGRNTAPAATIAALVAMEQMPDAMVLLLPADHVVGDPKAFLAAVERALPAASGGALVTFGIEPTAPLTGYGYIRAGDRLPRLEGVRRVAAFVEKPERAVAEQYLASGDYLWNSGMFLFGAAAFVEEVGRYAPEVLSASRAALLAGRRDLDFLRLDAERFAEAPSISIDYAVMERTGSAAVVPASMGWTDVGTWSALDEIGSADPSGNVCQGDVLCVATKNSYLRSEGPLLATVGLEDLVVIATDDAVLVARKDRDQDVKKIVDRLKADGRSEARAHRRLYRPWGYVESVHRGERFEVKRLTVWPGQKISLQKHVHRAEHWIVVNGTALVRRDGEELLLQENESIYIPLGTIHRLENPGRIPLNLIEVRSGSYLGEDDIVRLEDAYARV
jgi:mannose-1-phosphate guanylyltransferase/mannose-1-phosphate guanylyltransferase/mannose-6-phosphate isomerase